MYRGLLLAVLVCCVAGLVVPAGATSHSPFAQEDIDPDDVLLSVSIEEDTDAAWTVEYRLRLDTDEDRQAFEDIRTDIDANPDAYTDQFRARMNGTADTAESTTNRSMTITEMTVSAQKEQLPQEYGVVTYTFRWSNFAATDGERLVVGDAIQGMFLDEETTLLISWTDAHELLDASPDPTETREQSVVYTGELTFGGEQPQIELGPPGASSGGSGGLPLSPPVLVALLSVLAAGGAGAYAYRRRDLGSTDGDGATTQQSDQGSQSSDTADQHADSGDRTSDSASQSGSSDEASAAATASADIDQELLSNEEQVLRLIEQSGGRMKQQEVATQLDWTDAKTSQVVTQLRDDGALDGFRLGRENVLALPDETDEK
ncbi:helix-turn-helix transcriptional regulator [Halovenus marina]|uniref:helix-turn-helix transcriptional regulator n=1 Tax=Halovenus marina TaxID=3396621 RepID=UPI003F576A33